MDHRDIVVGSMLTDVNVDGGFLLLLETLDSTESCEMTTSCCLMGIFRMIVSSLDSRWIGQPRESSRPTEGNLSSQQDQARFENLTGC
jgi:hypothetical protein